MIKLTYAIDLTKDDRSLEALKIDKLTKMEASNFIHFLEKIKLDIVTREFGCDDDFEIRENYEDE